MGEYDNKEHLKLAYEQSIQAYQHHVQRYSTWMNMYAIMTGALLVAFYSVYGDDKIATPCNVFSKNIENVFNFTFGNAAPTDKFLLDDKSCLLMLICVLGFFCSLCWLGAVKGHYEWMKSFIQIVKFNEKKYFGDKGPFVYSKVMTTSDTKPKKGNYLYGFLSTQKITLTFIMFVILAWLICLIFIVKSTPLAVGLALMLILLIIFKLCKWIWRLLKKFPCIWRMLMDLHFKRIWGIFEYYHSTISPQEVIITDLNKQNTK